MGDPTTTEECLRQGFAALLRGDTAERDRLVRRAEKLMEAEHYAGAVERVLTVDFYVSRRGVAYRSTDLARAAGVIQ